MFLAEEAAKSGSFAAFDIFVIVFTLLIAAGVFRQAKAPKKNRFALAFGTVCLLVFLLMDVLMVLSWMGLLQGLQETIFG